LFAFLALIAAFFARSLRAMRAAFAQHADQRGAQLLGLQAAIVAALAVGLLDHYFFNIEFSHMVALFWGSIGLALAIEMADEGRKKIDDSPDALYRPSSSAGG
jgi:undecaprenyl pyrophosphate phosphatase UppP